MRFSAPGWLPGGVFACLWLVWLWHRYDKRQYAALKHFIAPHLRAELTQSISVALRRTRRGLYLAALALLFVALAGPQFGFHWEQTSRRGNEIVFAVDTSRSMTTPDVKPNRLTRAKLAIDDFAKRLDGDAIGLVAFAGNAFLACPITLDYGAFYESLTAIDTNTIPRGGTNIASAIREADNALQRRPGSDKTLVLITDGEDLEGDALTAAEETHQRDGLKIYTIGVGTANGDVIPVPADQGGGFVKDEKGAYVKSHLDDRALSAIATATGGLYAPLGTQGEGFDLIYEQALGPMAKHDLASRQQKIYIERYQWPLGASLAALLLSLVTGNRRRMSRPKAAALGMPAPAGATSITAALLVAAALAMAFGAGQPAHAQSVLPQQPAAPAPPTPAAPDEPPKSGNYPAAERAYAAAAARDAQNPVQHYNAGTAAYRAGRFPQAAQSFKQAINGAPSSDAERLTEQQDSYYNLGNTLYRTGQKTADSSPEQTLKTWNDAVKAYDTALQLRANDADSKYNRDLVKRKIDALQQKQNQKNPQNDKNKNKDDKNQDKNQKDQNGDGRQKPGGQQQAQQKPSPPDGGGNSPQDSQPPPGQPGQQPPPPSAQAQPKPASGEAKPQDATAEQNQRPGEAAQPSDDERQPGEMSRAEARQLLDSVKGEERPPLGAPVARSDVQNSPDPVKNW